MSIPNFGQIIGAAVQGALADTQAWLARQGQGGTPPPSASVPPGTPPPLPPGVLAPGGAIGQAFSQLGSNLQGEAAPVGQTFSNLGTAARQFQQYAGKTYTPDNTPQFDPHADGGSLGDPVQRFAQAILAEQQGKVDLPFLGGNGPFGARTVDYSKLPGPLNAIAHVAGAFDNAAGLTGEVLGHATTDAMGALTAATAGSSQAGYYALHPDQTPNASDQAYIDAFHALMQGHAGRANDIVAAQHPYLQGAQNLAGGFLPGAQAALPEELAANAPRLAALVDALNAVSKASVKPFELAPILHPIEATGIPLARRTLGVGDAAATAINAGTRDLDTAATAATSDRTATLAAARATTPAQRPLATIDADTERALNTYLNAQPAGKASAKADLDRLMAERQAWVDHAAQTPVATPAIPEAQSQITPNVDNSPASSAGNANGPLGATSPASSASSALAGLLNPNPGLVPPGFNSPPAVALGNVVGGMAQGLGNAAQAYKASFGDATQHLIDVNQGNNNRFLPGNGKNAIDNAFSAYRQEHKTWLGVPLRNYLGNMVNAAGAGGVSPLDYIQEVSTLQGNMPAYIQAREAALNLSGPAQQAALEQAHLDFLSPFWQGLRQQYGDTAVLHVLDKLGEDFQPQDAPAADVKAIQGAARGAVAGLASPRGVAAAATGVALPSIALDAARGALLPWRSRMQTNLLMPIDQAGRLKVAEQAIQGALADGATIDQAGDAGGQAAIRAFRDYKNGGDVPQWMNAIFPTSSWNVGQMHVMGNILQDHPELLPAAAIAAQHGLYPQVNRAEPQKTMTMQIDDRTPGLGLVARGINGGQAGTANLNPAYPFAPVGGDLLNVADEWAHPELHPQASGLQLILDTLDAGGLQLHPDLTMLLRNAGLIQGTVPNPDKLAKAGEAGDILLNNWMDANVPHTPGGDRLRNIAGHLPTIGGLPDYAGIDAGRVHDPAVDTAANELVYEQTGKPLSDPSNRAYVEQTLQPNSPLMRQAKVRAGTQLLGSALANNTAPGPVAASDTTKTQEALAQEALRAAGLTDDQITQLEIDTGNPLVDLQGGMLADAKMRNVDAIRIYLDDTPQARGQKLLDYWQQEHSLMSVYAPNATQSEMAKEAQRVGLVPAGTLLSQVHAYDSRMLGQSPLGAPILPPSFLPPGYRGDLNPNTIPQYLLPPGAGVPTAAR